MLCIYKGATFDADPGEIRVSGKNQTDNDEGINVPLAMRAFPQFGYIGDRWCERAAASICVPVTDRSVSHSENYS